MTMFLLSRLLLKPKTKPYHFTLLSNLSSKAQPYPFCAAPFPTHNPNYASSLRLFIRSLSTTNNNNNHTGNDQSTWKLSQEENDGNLDSFFTYHDDSVSTGSLNDEANDVFKEAKSGGDQWEESYKQWNLEEEEGANDHQVFDVGAADFQPQTQINPESERTEEEDDQEKMLLLNQEEKQLTAILKGPNRAFGDLIVASGITNAMLDNLIALKDFEGIEGLPPLSEIEDMRYEKSLRKSTRAEIERQKQEEVAKARVRQVDEKGRAYGTGRRKCSVARVWVQPGDGQFLINDKQFDAYFPMLEHRAALLRPFSESKTLGLWDVKCTVKGGGLTGQVGAIQLGISRALQNWEPGLRPALRSAGFLTRDSRVVERKKPGKAKARKSFQWVKR